MKLTREEKHIDEALVRGEYVPVSAEEFRETLEAIAARKKDRVLTLRVNSGDIRRIRKMAASRGVPYQSYISEIIHRVAVAGSR